MLFEVLPPIFLLLMEKVCFQKKCQLVDGNVILLLKKCGFLKENKLKLDHVPVVMAGDFSSSPSSPAIHFLMNQEFEGKEDNQQKKDRELIKELII